MTSLTKTLPAIVVAAFCSTQPLLACKCAGSDQISSRIAQPGTKVFVGRVVDTNPKSWVSFLRQLHERLEPFDIDTSENIFDVTLPGDALQIFTASFQEYWKGSVSAEAEQALLSIRSQQDAGEWLDAYVDEDSARIVRLDVSEAFSTGVGAQFEVRVGLGSPGDCSPPLEVGGEYLVFASRRAEMWTTSICHGTNPVEYAADDLTYLRTNRRPPAAGEPGR